MRGSKKVFTLLKHKSKKISVVIISYNRQEYIRECLDSVISQKIDKEIICIDDCSTDDTYEILKEYERKNDEIKVYQNKQNMGIILMVSYTVKGNTYF